MTKPSTVVEIETAEQLTEKLKRLKESKNYLNKDEIGTYSQQLENTMKLAAALSAKIQPLRKSGNLDVVPSLAEAVERLQRAVGMAQVQAEVDDCRNVRGERSLCLRLLVKELLKLLLLTFWFISSIY